MNFDTAALRALAAQSQLYYVVAPLAEPAVMAKTPSREMVAPSQVSCFAAAEDWVSGHIYGEAGRAALTPGVVRSSTGGIWVPLISPGTPSTVEPHGEGQRSTGADNYVWARIHTQTPADDKFSWVDGVALPAGIPWSGEFDLGVGDAVFAAPVITEGRATLVQTPSLLRACLAPGDTQGGRAVVAEGVVGGSGATGLATLSAGGVSSVAAVNAGAGYTTTRVVVTGDGAGAEVTANVVGGEVVGYTVVSAGTGYTRAEITVVAAQKARIFSYVASRREEVLGTVKTAVTADLHDIPSGVYAQLFAAGIPLGAPVELPDGVSAKINTVITPE